MDGKQAVQADDGHPAPTIAAPLPRGTGTPPPEISSPLPSFLTPALQHYYEHHAEIPSLLRALRRILGGP